MLVDRDEGLICGYMRNRHWPVERTYVSQDVVDIQYDAITGSAQAVGGRATTACMDETKDMKLG